MRIFLTLVTILAPIFAQATDDIVFPKITYIVTVSPAAQDKIAEGNRKIVADIYYDADFGEGDPQTVVYSKQLEIPANGGEVTAPALNFSQKLRDLPTENKLRPKFSALEFLNIYNPPNDGQFNVISCDVRPGVLFNLRKILAKEEIKVHAKCWLIGEK